MALSDDAATMLGTMVARGAVDAENVIRGYIPHIGPDRADVVFDALRAAGLMWLDGQTVRVTVAGLAAADPDGGRWATDPIDSWPALLMACVHLELPEPGSEHSHWRARPDVDRWVLDVGTGGHTRTVGAFPDRETAVWAGPEFVRVAREDLAAEWEASLVERHNSPWRVEEMRACLHSLPSITIDEPVGLAEIAERLGATRIVVDQWRTRGRLPAPDWTVGGRPAWRWSTIEEWRGRTS